MTAEGEYGERGPRGGKRHSGREESTELSFSRAGSSRRRGGSSRRSRDNRGKYVCSPVPAARPRIRSHCLGASRADRTVMGKAEQESNVIKPFIHIARSVKSSVTLFWRTSHDRRGQRRPQHEHAPALPTPSAYSESETTHHGCAAPVRDSGRQIAQTSHTKTTCPTVQHARRCRHHRSASPAPHNLPDGLRHIGTGGRRRQAPVAEAHRPLHPVAT